jgi:hypothetical protein
MALKHKITALTDVAEAVRTFYEEKDGAFYLQVEGMVPKAHVDEFRENNIQLKNKVTEYETKFKDIDPTKFLEYKAAAEKTPQAIDEAVRARVQQMQTEHTTVVNELTGKVTTLSQTLDTVLIDGSLKSEAAKAGILPTALDDVVLRGRLVFKTENGQPIAYDGKGQKMYDKDGTSPLSVGGWLKDLKKSAPHLFQGMQGGGAGGSGGRGPNGLDMSKATTNQKIAAGLASLDQA